MGAYTGNYSRNMHDVRNRYIKGRLQAGVPYVDADHNDIYDASYNNIKNLIIGVAGDGSPNNGFKVVGTSAVNDFDIKGGGGTFETAGRLYVDGHSPFLLSDITYLGTPASGLAGEDQRLIHSKITDTVFSSPNTTITDSAKNYVTNELAGRDLVPDVANAGTTFPIISNTATTIVVTGDATSAGPVGSRYRVNLSTPAGARTDGVYIDIYEDEIDSVEDPNLLHSLATNIEAQRRIRLESSIFVREDIGTHGEFTSYADSDANIHFVYKVANITRTATSAIDAGMVSDLRDNIIPGGASASTGSIKIWPASVETGWLVCDGNSLSTTTYADLFAVIAYQYGGAGASFNLPDMTGKFVIGVDAGGDADFDTLGETGGTKEKDISHVHVQADTGSAGGHDHGGVTGTENIYDPGTGSGEGGGVQFAGHDHDISAEANHVHTNPSTNSSGSATQDVMNPFIAMNYVIKF